MPYPASGKRRGESLSTPPDIVVGYRRPSGAEGLYVALMLGLCKIVKVDFAEAPFYEVGE